MLIETQLQPNPEISKLSSSQIETLHFLFNKRLELFNVRRSHEWQVFFGIVTAVAAVDAALLTHEDNVRNYFKQGNEAVYLGWLLILLLIFLCHTLFQLGVQARNRVDRLAMDVIYHQLCDYCGYSQVPESKSATVAAVRSRIDIGLANKPLNEIELEREVNNRWEFLKPNYSWAFTLQTVVLGAICIVSWQIPKFLQI